MGTIVIEDILAAASVREVQRLLEGDPDTIIMVGDADGVILWASTAGSLVHFGRDPATFVGHNRFDYVHDDDRARVRRMYHRALAGETVRFRTAGRAADGAWVDVVTVAWSEDTPSGRGVVTITTPLPRSGEAALPTSTPPA